MIISSNIHVRMAVVSLFALAHSTAKEISFLEFHRSNLYV